MSKVDLAFIGLLVTSIVAIVVPLRRRRDPDRVPPSDYDLPAEDEQSELREE